MWRYVSLVFVPLIVVGSDQISNVFYSTNAAISVYAEHLDSIREGHDTTEGFLTLLHHKIASRISIILCISPATYTRNRWKGVLNGMISRKLVRFLWIDECHYITSAGRHLRPEFYENIRVLVGMLWEKFPMLFCSDTMNKYTWFIIP